MLPAGAPRLRRKLQKVARQWNPSSWRPGSGAPNGSPDNKYDAGNNHSCAPALQAQPSQPLPPDQSDSKWLEYIRRRGFLGALDSSAQSNESRNIPYRIIPELSHLACDDAKSRGSHGRVAEPTLPSSSLSSSGTRRYAKTPVFSIGQLEKSRPRERGLQEAKETPVEILAEQYRALLASRCSMFTDSHAELPPSRPEHGDSVDTGRRSSDGLDAETAAIPLPDSSPTSDDGTLVSFGEETGHVKPVSLPPEPRSP